MGMRDLFRKIPRQGAQGHMDGSVPLIGQEPPKREIVKVSMKGEGVFLEVAQPPPSLYLLRHALSEAFNIVNQKLIAMEVAMELDARQAQRNALVEPDKENGDGKITQ